MPNGVKQYKIKIDGITETISQVDALNTKLRDLEARMQNLSSNGITTNVETSKADTSSYKEIDSLQKQILATEEKISQVRSEDYQKLLQAKQTLKEYTVEAKAAAAATDLKSGMFDESTMMGIKEKLKAIKQEMQTMTIGGDEFNKATEEANRLNEKLKELEQAYGVFGRNVGNYQSGLSGLEKLKVKVGETVVEFNSLRDAERQLKNGLGTLDENTQQYKDMANALHEVEMAQKRVNSAVEDAKTSSAAMDNLLDAMQSFTALASTAKGVSALFGIDNDELDKSIQKLLALQNVLKGIETIQQQINTGEGIGGWLKAGNSAINNFSTKIFGAKKTIDGVTTATKQATFASKAFGMALKTIGIGIIVSLIAELVTNWDSINDSINESFPIIKKMGGVMNVLKAAVIGLGKALINWFLTPLKTIIEVGKKLVNLDLSGALTAASDGLKQWFQGTADAFTEGFNDAIQDGLDAMAREQASKNAEMLKKEMEFLEAMYGEEAKWTKRYQELWNEYLKAKRAAIDPNSKTADSENRDVDIEEARFNKQRLDKQREYAKKVADVEKQLTNLRIGNMKEGLNKRLKQLEEERKAELAEVRENGIRVKELEREINKKYDKAELEAREEYAEKVKQTQKDLYNDLLEIERSGRARQLDVLEQDLETRLEMMKRKGKLSLQGSGYGSGWGGEESDTHIASYGIQGNLISNVDLKNGAEYIRLMRELNGALEMVNNAVDNDSLTYWSEQLEEAERKVKEFETAASGLSISAIAYAAENQNKDIAKVYQDRMEALKDFNDKYVSEAIEGEKAILEQRKIVNNDEKEAEIHSLAERRDAYIKELDKSLKEELITQKQYNDLFNKSYKAWREERLLVIKQYEDKEKAIVEQSQSNQQSIYEDSWERILQENRDFETAINNKASKLDTPKYNAMGIINRKATREAVESAKKDTESLINSLISQKEKLDNDYKNGLISADVYESTTREIDRQVQTATETLGTLAEKGKVNFGDFYATIDAYVQQFGQALSSILSSVWDYEDSVYEKRIEEMENYIDEYDKLLEEQEKITEEHNKKVDDIEKELSNSRGARRQQLIDQLNREKAAQRASLQEEKRIEKEKEKLEKKKEQMELEQRRREHNRQVTQAVINAALAVSQAAVNHWPLPAIPMVAAATALGAAQIALIKKQKYAKGGMLEGKSHSQGGIPIGSTGIEVEGKEYVIRKRSSMPNVGLLDYINRSERKLDLSDFIDFFDGKVKKNVRSASPKKVFADGGVIPTLRNDLDVSARLATAMEQYANRPYYVSVVEIEDVQSGMNQVRALSGIDR